MHKKVRAIHMIGIGGSGMSGIAEVLLNLGYKVNGSDMSENATVKRLCSLGAEIHIGHHADNITNPHVVVRSTAIRDDNPEIIAAREKKIPVIGRAEMLAELMRLRKGIAIAGTHGKTTTTSLTASIFDAAHKDPTVIIGGLINAYGANARLGQGKYLIAEADESDGSFLCLFPIINVVTNIDFDHVDFYGSQEKIDEAFIAFMNKVPFYGRNIVCGDDDGCMRILPHIKRPCTTYGFGMHNHIRAEIVDCSSSSTFNVYIKSNAHEEESETFWAQVVVNHPGKHNILNALAAIGVALETGLSKEACLIGLANFQGVGRRFERKGCIAGIEIIDDYGHHPTEISATIRCAKQVFPSSRIIMAFQPHRFSRTQSLFAEFSKCFEHVDKLYLCEIYAASEKAIPGISGQSLALGVQQVSCVEVEYVPKAEDLENILLNELQEGDILITQGAGSITKLAQSMKKALEEQSLSK